MGEAADSAGAERIAASGPYAPAMYVALWSIAEQLGHRDGGVLVLAGSRIMRKSPIGRWLLAGCKTVRERGHERAHACTACADEACERDDASRSSGCRCDSRPISGRASPDAVLQVASRSRRGSNRWCARAGSRRVQTQPVAPQYAKLQGFSDVTIITRNEGVRGSNPRVGLRFAGVSGDCVVGFGNTSRTPAEHQPNTSSEGIGLLGTSKPSCVSWRSCLWCSPQA